MPTYEYKCDGCRKKFSVVESISEHGRKRPVCPKCKSRKVSRIIGPVFTKTAKKS